MNPRTIAMLVVIAAGLAGGAALSACRRGANAPATSAAPVAASSPVQQDREALFAELQPVKLANCELARFGEANDGGYVMCRNLAGLIEAAYSYGISGYDGWGCDVSKAFRVPVHQYDCFNVKEPVCAGGRTIFHPECIAGHRSTDASGRLFDTMQAQLQKNGDGARHVIVKMDVEGAEWDSMQKAPDAVFDRIDQMIFEFHGVEGDVARSLEVVRKLKKFFHVVHLHFNNYSCQPGVAPFPAWAYEVTLVNKRLGVPDPAGTVPLPSALDTPNAPGRPDCQTAVQ